MEVKQYIPFFNDDEKIIQKWRSLNTFINSNCQAEPSVKKTETPFVSMIELSLDIRDNIK
jgi:hypothetical protein